MSKVTHQTIDPDCENCILDCDDLYDCDMCADGVGCGVACAYLEK